MQAHPISKEPKSKPLPCPNKSSSTTSSSLLDFNHRYLPHPSGIDSNLLILFHGLGDNENNFINFARSIQSNLPQTSILVLGGQNKVPMFPEATCWWDSFTVMAEPIPNPDPTSFLNSFTKLMDHLTKSSSQGGIGWKASNIHLFGFGQGGSAALEGSIAWTRSRRKNANSSSDASNKIQEIKDEKVEEQKKEEQIETEVGSVVSVSGGLLSHPTFTPPLSTPVLLFHRSSSFSKSSLPSIKKAYQNVTEHKAKSNSNTPGEEDESMPRGDEWGPVMRFWSKFFKNRNTWEIQGEGEGDGEIYSVKSG